MGFSHKRDKKLDWLLMYLAGNHCDSCNSFPYPGGGMFFCSILAGVATSKATNLGGPLNSHLFTALLSNPSLTSKPE